MGATFNIPFKAISGRNGRVTLQAVILAMGKWATNVQATDVTIRNFELQNPGFDYGVPGIISAEATFSGAWNLLSNLHLNPPNANPGQVVSDLKLFLSKSANIFWEFPEIRILGGSMNCEMDQFINYDVSSKANGGFFFPGGIQATIGDI